MGLLSALRRLGQRAVPASDEVIQPLTPPPRDIGRASDGSVLPVSPAQPFRNSLRGGNEDLLAAARMIRQEDWPQFMALVSAGMGAAEAVAMINEKRPAAMGYGALG